MLLLGYRMIRFVAFCTICLLSFGNVFVRAAVPAAAPAAAPPHLDFQAGAPGRCGGCSDCTVNPPPAVSTRGAAAAGTPQLYEHFALQDSTGANADIYFPMDGRQPTTPEAALWSCANVDANNLHSPVTRWYRHMFFRSLLGTGFPIMNWG